MTSARAADVFVHIGLPKTGTTYLQGVLWKNRERLAENGVLIPGERRSLQNQAAWDLLGRRPRGAELPQVAGSWQRLVEEVRGWSGTHAVMSEEFLAFARPRQVRQAVQALAPRQVHVVVTVRDLARVIVGSWQQQLASGRAWTWEEYAAAVRDPERGPASAGVAFWLRQDVARVLATWEAAVPRERVHVVTVPPPGSPPELLLERFATAVRLDPRWLPNWPEQQNLSVGAADAEVLRRLNAALGDRLNERQYTRAVAHGVRPVLQGRRSPAPMGLPVEQLGWVSERAGVIVEELRDRGYDVVGDLDDLVPAPVGAPARPDGVEPGELAEAALAALEAAVEQFATLWWRTRAAREGPGDASAAGPQLASSARAAAGRARLAAFELADRNRLARWAASRYLNRSTPARPRTTGSE